MPDSPLDQLPARIASQTAQIGVIGLGYVGLPLAVEFAKAGFWVTGIDLNQERVARVNAGQSHILDVPGSTLEPLVQQGRLRAAGSFGGIPELDIIFICVPTPHDPAKSPDLSYIKAASAEIGQRLRRGQLIILESTTYPGTTEEVMLPLLRVSGLEPGVDFAVAFSPERVDPGNQQFDTSTTPKVVGGLTPRCAALTKQVFEQIINGDGGAVHVVSNPRAAEMTKLLENCFRSVNIALVNELALLCDRMGINIWEVIDAAATKPFGYMPFYPGPGVGGHCIPVDPYYLSWKAREFDFYTKFIELAAETNLSMPFYVVSKVREVLNGLDQSLRDASILVLGAAFKRDVNDARNSPSVRVIELLLRDGARVDYHDPHIPGIRVGLGIFNQPGQEQELRSVPLTAERLGQAACVLLTVPHSAFDFNWIVEHARAVVDCVNATKHVTRFREKITLI